MLILAPNNVWLFGDCLLHTKLNPIYSSEVVFFILSYNVIHVQNALLFNKMKFNDEFFKKINEIKIVKT